jgi:hypothetical protein
MIRGYARMMRENVDERDKRLRAEGKRIMGSLIDTYDLRGRASGLSTRMSGSAEQSFPG